MVSERLGLFVSLHESKIFMLHMVFAGNVSNAKSIYFPVRFFQCFEKAEIEENFMLHAVIRGRGQYCRCFGRDLICSSVWLSMSANTALALQSLLLGIRSHHLSNPVYTYFIVAESQF